MDISVADWRRAGMASESQCRNFLANIGSGPKCPFEWIGGKRVRDYGRFGVGSRKTGGLRPILAHRLAYLLFVGEIAPGMCVRHKCDNPPCCTPDHLELGTHQQNSQDMIRRGRHLAGKARRDMAIRGEGHGMAVLTDDAVREILQMICRGCRHRQIQERFGVSHGCVSSIARGQSWRHIERPPNMPNRNRVFAGWKPY